MTETNGADRLREEIEQTRAELAQTVDALSAKLDVKAQAKHRVQALNAKSEPYRIPIAAGAAAIVALVVLVKIRRRS
jgi:hypothetical protein